MDNNTASPRLLDQLRTRIRYLHYSIRTEKAYVFWVRRYIYFHNKRHPQEMGGAEIVAFLNYLASKENVAAATQNQALNALVFLYKKVLGIELGEFPQITYLVIPSVTALPRTCSKEVTTFAQYRS